MEDVLNGGLCADQVGTFHYDTPHRTVIGMIRQRLRVALAGPILALALGALAAAPPATASAAPSRLDTAGASTAHSLGDMRIDGQCESGGEFMRCMVSIVGAGSGPFTIRWFVNNVHRPDRENWSIIDFFCGNTKRISVRVVATDSTGAGATAEIGTVCRTGDWQ